MSVYLPKLLEGILSNKRHLRLFYKVVLLQRDYTNVDWRDPLRLLEAIFADFVASEIKQLFETCDCAVDDAWHTFGVETVKRLKNSELVWGSFLDAAKILKIAWCSGVREHFKRLQNEDIDLLFVYELEELYNLERGRDVQCILNYLYYRRDGK